MLLTVSRVQGENTDQIVELVGGEAAESHRTEQLSRVTMTTTVLNKQSSQPWIEVIILHN